MIVGIITGIVTTTGAGIGICIGEVAGIRLRLMEIDTVESDANRVLQLGRFDD